MVKRTITITTILLILTIAVGLIVMLNKSSFAAEDDIASGTSGTCSWVIDKDGVLTISPTDGVSGTLADSSENGPWYDYRTQITKLIVDEGVCTGENCSRLFYDLNSCAEMNVDNLDTSNANNMNSMFYDCRAVKSLDVSNFNVSNVTNIGGMFAGSEYDRMQIEEIIGLDKWDTSNVTNMNSLFRYDTKLRDADISKFNTSSVTDMSYLFQYCEDLDPIDVSNWNTSSVTNMYCLFYRCESVKNLDVSRWNTSNVTDMSSMFNSCAALTSIDVSRFDTSHVTSFCAYNRAPSWGYYDGLFGGCSSLVTLDLSNWDVSKASLLMWLFKDCYRLESIDLSGWDTSNATDMRGMFSCYYSPPKIKRIIIGENFKFDGNNISYYKAYFPTSTDTVYTGKWIREDEAYGPFTPEELRNNYTPAMAGTWIWEPAENPYAVLDANDTLNFMRVKAVIGNNTIGEVKSISGGEFTGTIFTVNEGGSNNGDRTWNNIATRVKKVIFIDEIKPKDTSYWFDSFHECTDMDLSKLNTSETVNMNYMFNDCDQLDSLDVSSFNTSNVTSMKYTFNGCKSLTSMDISNFDVSKVTILEGLFKGCIKLKSVNVNGWNVSNVRRFNHMFYDTSIETLDLSSFDTSSAYYMEGMFNNVISLKSIVLGENFKFKGDNISRANYQAILPTPTGSGYSGKWIREDKEFGPYTADALRINYDGSTMAGKWVWDKFKYKVEYKFDGTIPNGVSSLPEEAEYEFDSQVTVAQNATAPGYTFSGWSRTGTFEMPAEKVEITGSFTANTDTPYKVEHYLEDLNEGKYTLTKTDNLTGTTDTEAQATAKDYEGFTFDDSIDGTMLSGNIDGDGNLVLKLYYKRNSYNVTFAYTGSVPDDASPLPQGETYKYGAEINVPEEATLEGYTFSGWIKDYINMPAQDIEITGYFIENPKSYNYKVEYYFDGELDSSLEEILNAEKDEEISITPQTPLKHGERNYTLISNNHNITISINEEENVINVYYEADVLDYEIDNPEDTTEGDGIPDKYQIKITYKVENGSWDDGTKGTKTDVITLKDKDGNYAENGEGNLNIPQVGNKPAEGYSKGLWNKDIPNIVSKTNDGDEYTYSYKKNEIVKADISDISETDGKSSNPKTQDIMPLFLLIGTTGIAVLIIAKSNRRKYSRKARDIQF